MVQRVFPASGVQRIAVRQERLPAELFHQVRHRFRVVGPQESQVAQLAEMHFDGGEFSVKGNIRDSCPAAQLLQLDRQADILHSTKISKVYFRLWHISSLL